MLTKLHCSVKEFTHIIHVADIHIRLTKRHEEYTDIFNKFYAEAKKTPDTTAIAILGDLFHSKSDLSPECVLSAKDFLFNCAELRPTILIAGNHDATLTNKNRLDSLTPIIGALNHKNLFYLKNNGLYSLGDILFNNMSIFSDSTEYLSYDDIPKNHKNTYKYHIALYHGPVNSALTDLGFYLVNKAMPVEVFDGHHIVLLGDIHRKQDLQYYNDFLMKPAVHYPGSMIQQNHGEPIDGHGFSLWDLKTKTYTHFNILNDYGFFTVEVNKGKLVTDLTNIPKKARVNVKCFESVTSEVKAAVATIKSTSKVEDVTYIRIDSPNDPSQLKVNTTINLSDIADISYQNKLLTDYLKNKCNIADQAIIDSVLSINTKLNGSIEKDKLVKNVRWKPKKFEFSNMFSYGEDNVVDFSKAKDVMGLFGPNTCGKSSIFSALSFCIFDKFDRGYKAKDILNVQKSNFSCKFNFEINGIDFFIERKGQANRKGEVKVDVKFWKEENGKVIELNGEARRNTNDIIKDCVGSYEDFILTSLSVQSGKNVSSFIDMGQSERKDLLSQFIGLVLFDKLLELASDESKNVLASLRMYKKEDHESKIQLYSNELSSLTSVFNDETNQVADLIAKRDFLNGRVLEKTKLLIPINGKIIDIGFVKKQILDKQQRILGEQNKSNEIIPEIIKIQNEIDSFDTIIADLDKKDVLTVFKKYQTLNTEFSHLEQVLELKKVEVGDKIKKHEMLKKHEYDPNCKYCVNSVFVKDAQKIAGELEGEKIKVTSLLEQRNKLKKELEEIKWVVQAQEDYTSNLRKRNNLKGKIGKIGGDKRTSDASIIKFQAELDELNKAVENYNSQMQAIESNRYIQTEIDQFTLDIKNVDFNINQKNKKLIEIGGRISLLKNLIDELIKAVVRAKELEKEYESYNLYLKAVNRDGLPYMIICNTVPEVEREVNTILNQMVEFHLNIETDGKNVTPYIVYDDKRWPIEMASGFEKFVSSLAIRVALINISNLPRPNFLVVDEGFGVIDSNNMPSVQTLFSFLKVNFDFLIIISHLDVLRDMVDKQIEIKKDGGFSSVKFV